MFIGKADRSELLCRVHVCWRPPTSFCVSHFYPCDNHVVNTVRIFFWGKAFRKNFHLNLRIEKKKYFWIVQSQRTLRHNAVLNGCRVKTSGESLLCNLTLRFISGSDRFALRRFNLSLKSAWDSSRSSERSRTLDDKIYSPLGFSSRKEEKKKKGEKRTKAFMSEIRAKSRYE